MGGIGGTRNTKLFMQRWIAGLWKLRRETEMGALMEDKKDGAKEKIHMQCVVVSRRGV